jgi:hypothetical protein
MNTPPSNYYDEPEFREAAQQAAQAHVSNQLKAAVAKDVQMSKRIHESRWGYTEDMSMVNLENMEESDLLAVYNYLVHLNRMNEDQIVWDIPSELEAFSNELDARAARDETKASVSITSPKEGSESLKPQ